MEMLWLQVFLLKGLFLMGTQNPGIQGSFQQAQAIGTTQPTEMVAASQQVDEAQEVETVVISPIGFEPKEITRPRGAFILDVVNLSGLDELNVDVMVEPGHSQNPFGKPLYSGTVSLERQDWNIKVNVPLSRYQIVEANHPNDVN